MSLPTKTRQYILAKKPTAEVDISQTFSLKTIDLAPVQKSQLLLQTLYLSNDPAQRGWIQAGADPARLYVPPVPEGEPMRARAICKVLASESSKFKVGQLVAATTGWVEHAVVPEAEATPVPDGEAAAGLAATQFLGALGGTGLTALYGLEVVRAGKEDGVLVVSGAAGATGSMVVQIAKRVLGVRKVVGIAGTEDKCRWVESLGADVCVNYKNADFEGKLKEATEGGQADVFFDNVGGNILDLMLGFMKRYGRIAACGSISTYNSKNDAVPMRNWFEIVIQRLEVRGFIIFDAAPKFAEMQQTLLSAYKDGKIKLGDENETVVPTKFEDVPKTWLKLFSGGNTGKLVTKIE